MNLPVTAKAIRRLWMAIPEDHAADSLAEAALDLLEDRDSHRELLSVALQQQHELGLDNVRLRERIRELSGELRRVRTGARAA